MDTNKPIAMHALLMFAKSALEEIKDAPLSSEEINQISEEALHLCSYGFHSFNPRSTWGKTIKDIYHKDIF